MATLFERIDEHHRRWIARQSMFFVATAPLSGDGHVNLRARSLDGLPALGDWS
jgi:hypothetical protein